jgi:hypothetical protein
MPTPDRFPGQREEDSILFTDNPDALVAGEMKYSGGAFVMKDGTGEFDPRAGGGGISEAQHKTLRHLIHFIDEGPGDGFASGATKTVTGGLFPTSILWRDSAGNKLVEKLIERSAGSATNLKPTPIKWKIYDGAGDAPGNVLFTISDAITYTGVSESGRIRTITVGDA